MQAMGDNKWLFQIVRLTAQQVVLFLKGIDGAKLVKSLRDDFGVTSRATKTNEKERSFALPIWVI